MSTSTQTKKPKALHVVLWVAQVILAGMFLMAGFMKLTTSIEELSQGLPWAADAPALVRFIGLSELLGGLGLILPAALRIKPYLTIWAAIGLAVIMLLAIIFHVVRGEVSAIGMNIGLGVLALFVVWGRSKKARIVEKGKRESGKVQQV